MPRERLCGGLIIIDWVIFASAQAWAKTRPVYSPPWSVCMITCGQVAAPHGDRHAQRRLRDLAVVVGGHGRGLRFSLPKTRSSEARVDLDGRAAGALMAHRLKQDVERTGWGAEYADHGLVFAREDGDPYDRPW